MREFEHKIRAGVHSRAIEPKSLSFKQPGRSAESGLGLADSAVLFCAVIPRYTGRVAP